MLFFHFIASILLLLAIDILFTPPCSIVLLLLYNSLFHCILIHLHCNFSALSTAPNFLFQGCESTVLKDRL